MGHGPHSSTLVVICVVRLLFVLFYVLFVCKCVLPSGDNSIAVNKYIIFYTLSYNLPAANKRSTHKIHNAFSLLLSEYLQLVTPRSRILLEEDYSFSKSYPHFLNPKTYYCNHKSRLIVSRISKIILTKALQSCHLKSHPMSIFFFV
jgi:hypothetical protein